MSNLKFFFVCFSYILSTCFCIDLVQCAPRGYWVLFKWLSSVLLAVIQGSVRIETSSTSGGVFFCLFILARDLYRSWRCTFYPVFPVCTPHEVAHCKLPLCPPPGPPVKVSAHQEIRRRTKTKGKARLSPNPPPPMP